MRIEELDYDLPPSLIATQPVEPRDSSRLLVVSRTDPARIEHRRFAELTEFLRQGDLLVFNNSAVVPARWRGRRADTSGAVEGLYLKTVAPGQWDVLMKSGGRLGAGVVVTLQARDGSPSNTSLRLERRSADGWVVSVHEKGEPVGARTPTVEILRRVGLTPLPPYIVAARRDQSLAVPDTEDRRWYQTVYSNPHAAGSVAAPTAGLHFTQPLLDRISASGVQRAPVTLHVGLGTFRPVQTEDVRQHPIHAEWSDVPSETISLMEAARAAGCRIIPVGTTSVRALESLPVPLTDEVRRRGIIRETRLLITPGFDFRWTDGLITNFHLPRSTLLALVGALFAEGVPRLLEIYRLAIEQGYRFYSYGDAMLILP